MEHLSRRRAISAILISGSAPRRFDARKQEDYGSAAAYNAAETLKRTFDEIPHDIVDDIILTDDASKDATVEMAQNLGIPTIRHDRNRGYGGNQKTCYTAALARGADIVVMLHPDYQYTPKLVTAMASMIASGEFDVVLASRILGRGALVGGMPIYKYVSNRFLTLFEKSHG
jgi:glycosyltransferase involved in cell wall biosynthesis